MVVVDASAMVEVLLLTPLGREVGERIFSRRDSVHSPHLLDLEVAQVLRRFCLSGALTTDRARQALSDLRDFRMRRYAHDLFLPRIWELRHNVTAYDAAYIALAEKLDLPLLTTDAKFVEAPGHRVQVELFRQP